MMETLLNPVSLQRVDAIWRKNLEMLPVETRNYLNRASDMLIAEMARADVVVKRQLIAAWLCEVAYGSESRRHPVTGCGWRVVPTCGCNDGYGHKWPAVKWTDLSIKETVFDVVYMTAPKSGAPVL